MRKFTQAMLVLLAFLGSTIGAVAQNNYPVNVSETATITNPKRVVSGVTLQPERGLLQSTNVKEGRLAYNDMTETANGTFKIKAGQTVYPKFVFSQWSGRTGVEMGDWMHSYLFVDTNDNKVFDVSGKDVANDELLAYYKTASNGNTYTNDLDGFSISKTGTFRMRYLIVWNASVNSETSKGNTDIPSKGGIIVDVNLQVEALNVTSVGAEVTYDTAPVCGQAFTFSVPAQTGFATAVSVKCGDDFDAEQTTSTIYYKTKSSVTTYNWEQFTPTDNGDGTYTVPADKMKGDLQITVTYTKDVMALIKAGKQVFRLKNRSTSTYPYLMADHVDAMENTDRVVMGTDILYHAALDANNACQLWRLKAGQADNTYYLCSQGLQAGTIEVSDKVVVKMVESGEPYRLWSKVISGTTYYGFSRSSTTSDTEQYFLHAVAFGKSHPDTWYPASNKGDYVTRWDFGTSTTASQWTFEAVDEIGITIGTSGYASVNYDFPVKFPAGVKVYKKAEEAATYIRLAEITPGADGCVSLPTGNAAFVAGTPRASITLEILLDEPADIGDTGVNGTYLATTFNEGDAANIYGIAKVNDVVAFYKMKANTTIKQNKGYIESATNNAPRMELTFGEGETTGIESMLEDNSRRESIDTSVLYDLNGRRVLYPSRGIYVTAGGQRIFLK